MGDRERLLAALRVIADAVILTDEKVSVDFMNPAAETLTGWKQQDAQGKGLADIFQITGATDTLYDGFVQRTFQDHALLISKNGTEIPIDYNAALIRDESKNITGFILVFRDITDRKRIVEALRRSRKRYKELAEELSRSHTQLELRVQERTADLLRANETLQAEIVERKRAEKTLNNRIELEKLISNISTCFINLPLNEIDREIEKALQKIGEFVGADRSYVLIFSDDEKRMNNTHEWCDKTIDSQKKRFENLTVDALPWTMEKLRQLQTIHIPSVARLSSEGYSEKYQFDSSKSKSVIRVPLAYGGSLVGCLGFDSVLEEKDWSKDIIALLQIAGEIFVNALERRQNEQLRNQLEDQLRQSHKLEAMGRLSGSIAQDMNNTLMAISAYCEQLLLKFSSSDPVQQDVAQIHKASQHAAVLTRKLLAFSRQQILSPKDISLNDVVSGMNGVLHRLLGTDTELFIRLDSNLALVKADPEQMERVIKNLALNAHDAMPEGGRLTLETANVELDENFARDHFGAVSGRYVMLSVSDTGSGIDETTKPRIFEPFFTTKEGTGLGLSTVYGIVMQSGGYIWVDSEPGRGSSFKIYLPRVEE